MIAPLVEHRRLAEGRIDPANSTCLIDLARRSWSQYSDPVDHEIAMQTPPQRKIGRNELCPCGSGKKFKRCHGSTERLDDVAEMLSRLPTLTARMRARELQREQQQGLGRPIVSAEIGSQRFVAVGGRLLHSSRWKSFHDFLIDYLKGVLGAEWGEVELAKPADARHPVIVWYQLLCEHQRTFIVEPGKVVGAPMTGAVAAFLSLAYDLYALEHSAEVQRRLLGRLRNHKTFEDALQEVRVAAHLLRAGFELEFEDEDDGSSTHVEFTATSKRTAKKFSVEVKRRHADRTKVNRLLHRALVKEAAHERIVFIEVNEPDSLSTEFPPKVLKYAQARLFQYERDPGAAPLPRAFVFVTNAPWMHSLTGQDHRCSLLLHGFRIPEVQQGHPFVSLRAAVDARDQYREIYDIARSMRDHATIPSTFDGEAPSVAFHAAQHRRLLVGERVLVPDETGANCEGVLEQGLVMPESCAAFCVVRLSDGRRILCTVPLTPEELEAWRQHPQTFFGVIDQNVKPPVKDPIGFYDFFFDCYRSAPREQLLQLIKGEPDFDELSELDTYELARTSCERMAWRAMALGQAS